MPTKLYSSKDFGVITFNNTSQALKAEKVLDGKDLDFAVIPTPREISASCGLSVKVFPEDIETASRYLDREKVEVSGIYRLVR